MWPYHGRGPLWRLLLLLWTLPLGADETSACGAEWEQWRLGRNMLSSLSSWYILGSRMGLFKLPKPLVVLAHLGTVGASRGRDWISQHRSSQKSFISVFPFPITNLSPIPSDSTAKIKMNPSAFPYFCCWFEMKKASLGPGNAFLVYQPPNSYFHLLPVEFTLHRIQF